MIQIKMQNKDFRRDAYQQVLDLSALIIHMMVLLLQYGGVMVDAVRLDRLDRLNSWLSHFGTVKKNMPLYQ